MADILAINCWISRLKLLFWVFVELFSCMRIYILRRASWYFSPTSCPIIAILRSSSSSAWVGYAIQFAFLGNLSIWDFRFHGRFFRWVAGSTLWFGLHRSDDQALDVRFRDIWVNLNLPKLILFKIFTKTFDFSSLHQTDKFYVLSHKVMSITRNFGNHGSK